jgi:RsiW-degrading membrane proteinase PrsW (M82 family)
LTTFRNSQLITPPREEEEVYPYRHAWRSLITESILLVIVTAIFFLAFNFLRIPLPSAVVLPANIMIVTLPAILWVLFSRVPENSVPQPRRRLLTVFIISALTANAIGVPLVERVFQPDQWLSNQSLVTRILGYAFTVGILHEFLKFLVLRYVVWPTYYRVRSDAVAYGVATAIGYAVVLNINYLVDTPSIQVGALVLRVFSTIILQVAGSLIVAYGLSETRFNNPLSILLPVIMVFASLIHGVVIPLRTSFVNRPIGLTPSASRDILGLVLDAVVYIGVFITIYFLFTVSEKTENIKQGI